MSVHLLASALVSGGAGGAGGAGTESLWVLAGSSDPELGGLGGEVSSSLLSNVSSRQLSPFPAFKPSHSIGTDSPVMYTPLQ